MKKQIKIVSVILIVMMAIASISSVVLGTTGPLSGDIKDIASGNASAKPTQVTALGKTIVTIMQTVRNSCCSCYIINIRY